MSLLRFELRKLLLNKKTLVMFAVLFAVYGAVGFVSSYFVIGGSDNFQTYSALAEPYEGSFNAEKAAEATAVYDALKQRYGNAVDRQIARDPEPIFEVHYAKYAETVNEYHYGSISDIEPYGVNVLREKLAELEEAGQTQSFEYRKLADQLAIELSHVEPIFANTLLWVTLFNNWGRRVMQFLMFIPLAFLIAPVFSREVETGMNNLILSSRNGRGEIVTAKLISAAIAASALVGVYVFATFVFGFLSLGTFAGWDAPLRSVSGFARSPLNLLNWQFAIVSAVWLLICGIFYAVIISFVSSLTKSVVAAAGSGLVVFFIDVVFGGMGETIMEMIKPVVAL